jgi:predicted DsbA family dithiol-disulfide isomerase
MKKLRIDVWSDIACPWCHVGKRRLEAALARFPYRDAVEVVWRAFELDPSAPRERDPSVSYSERLARKYGCSVPEAEAMIQRMTDVARQDGLDFHFERIRPGNTFDAHRVLHLAAERGKQDTVKERFFRGYLTEGEPIGDPEALVRLAPEAGLDPDEVRATLASDAYAREVRAEEIAARELGIGGVPFFVIGGRYAISGAQPADVFLRALTKAWSELEAQPEVLEVGPPEVLGNAEPFRGPSRSSGTAEPSENVR